jgi:hypothetical protein
MKEPVLAAVIAMALVACSDGSSLPEVPSTIVPSDQQSRDSTTTSTRADGSDDGLEAETTTTTFARLLTPPTEAPPFEEVTITTADGIDLYGQFWEGGDVAVIYTHEYNAAQAGSFGARPPQSSETVSTSTWTMADNGLTVLAFDFRGHGQSDGDYNVKESQLDMRAAYEFLVDRGYTKIVGMPFGGSAPVMANLSAFDDTFVLAGIGMLFTPLAETGFDAKQALSEIDEPVWLVGIDVGSFGGVTKRLEPSVQNLYGRIVFPAVPSGVQFADVYGSEYLGRQLDFIRSVTGEG